MEHHPGSGTGRHRERCDFLATGYRSALPQILPSLVLITVRQNAKCIDDFTLEWRWPRTTSLRGPAWWPNPCRQLAMAWNLRILNRVMGRDLFDLGMPPATLVAAATNAAGLLL